MSFDDGHNTSMDNDMGALVVTSKDEENWELQQLQRPATSALISEEKKSEASDSNILNLSYDSETDNLLWSDNPETEYFRQMMEDKQMKRLEDGRDTMDDSVLGMSTIASLLGGGDRRTPDQHRAYGDENDNSEDFSSSSISSTNNNGDNGKNNTNKGGGKSATRNDSEITDVAAAAAAAAAASAVNNTSSRSTPDKKNSSNIALSGRESPYTNLYRKSPVPIAPYELVRSETGSNSLPSAVGKDDMDVVGMNSGEFDDLSTIANDTLDGRMMSGNANAPQPRTRSFKEYNTPKKKKKVTNTRVEGRAIDSDDETQPETPPGYIRVPSSRSPRKKPSAKMSREELKKSKKKLDDLEAGGKPKDQNGDSAEDSEETSNTIYIVALLLGVVLIAAIGGLSIVLIGLRRENNKNSPTPAEEGEKNPPPASPLEDAFPDLISSLAPADPGTAPVSSPTSSPTLSPIPLPTDAPVVIATPAPVQITPSPVQATPAPVQTSSPATPGPVATPDTSSPTVETLSPTDSLTPTDNPTLGPSVLAVASDVPTVVPTTSPGPTALEASNDFMALLTTISPESIAALDDRESPQFKSFDWMINDPNYFTYSEDRLRQRWVMGIMGYDFRDRSIRFQSDTPTSSVLADWLDYESNECTWFSTRPDTVCDRDGLISSLHIRDQFLYGTLPAELSILSNSLTQLFLAGNNIFGTIPTQFGQLTLLKRIQFTKNRLTGPIPSEFGNLVELEVLGLGRNELGGSLPTELGNLGGLSTAGLEGNEFVGVIPTEYGGLTGLDFLSLESNNIGGLVPTELGLLTKLEHLKLGGNLIGGVMPNEICALRFLITLSVDCSDISCHCCTECSDSGTIHTIAPTLAPVTSSTPAPVTVTTPAPVTSSTPAPVTVTTPAPVPTPTDPSTSCAEIAGVSDCFAEGDEIVLALTNCQPRDDDWVGLYYEWTDEENLSEAVAWAWACGDNFCRGSVSEGQVSLGEDISGTFPFPRERYIARLLQRDSQGDFQIIAESDRFRVRRDC